MNREDLADRVRAKARELGFGLVGIAGAEASDHAAFFRSWIEEGRHGEMEYLERPDALERRTDLSRTLESIRSVVVVGHNYFLEDPDGVPGDPSRGVVARYARGRDYHKVVKKGLRDLHRWLEDELDGPVEGRAYTDTGPILERELAQRAGLGWFGKNTMLLHPRRGSYFFLGVLLLELDLPPDEPFREDHCGTCRRCLDACPTDALLGRNVEGAPVMEATRCISYLTIEHRGPIPRKLRPKMGNRVFGCDICQEVCPFNVKFALETTEPGYAARGPGERPVGVEALPGEEGFREKQKFREEGTLQEEGAPGKKDGSTGESDSCKADVSTDEDVSAETRTGSTEPEITDPTPDVSAETRVGPVGSETSAESKNVSAETREGRTESEVPTGDPDVSAETEIGSGGSGPGARSPDVSAETRGAQRIEAPSARIPIHPGTGAPSLIDLLSMALSEEGWESFSRGSAIRRAGRAGFGRNVCVALGNWLEGEKRPNPDAVEVLLRALSDPEPLVRGHAAWALGEVGSSEARTALGQRLEGEDDPFVREEVEAALES